jgi:hypothetical protein
VISSRWHAAKNNEAKKAQKMGIWRMIIGLRFEARNEKQTASILCIVRDNGKCLDASRKRKRTRKNEEAA